MSLFGRSQQNVDVKAEVKDSPVLQLGELSGLALPFKKAEKSDLERSKIDRSLDDLKRFPVRLLEEASTHLTRLNRLLMTPKQRQELADQLTSYIYPIVQLWYNKYQKEENSLPESHERRNALVASINAIQQLSVPYKLLFSEYYSSDRKKYQKDRKQAYKFGARSLELMRLEQRLCALRYQKLAKVTWQHCNQVFFSLVNHNDVDDDYDLIGLIGVKKSSDKLRQGGVPKSSVRKLYLSTQMFGLLDVTTWPTRMFNMPDLYLDMLGGEGLKVLADNGKPLQPGFLLTYYNNNMPPLFKRMDTLKSTAIRFDYSNLYNTLVRDHKEIAKQQFLEQYDASAYSKVLATLGETDRVPLLELMIMGLTSKERRQKRHASFDQKGISVYFGFHDVNRLLKDIIHPDKEKVRDSRQFIDTLAMSSAMLADEKEHHMSVSWTITNFSSGGLLISTVESDFSNPIQIDMLVAFTMPDNKEHPILGFVRRLNRPDARQVEVAIVRLSNYAESAAVQDLKDIDSSTAKAAILIKGVRGDWNLIIKTSMPYLKGQPLKLIRANGHRLPVRLGEVIYTKKDFKVFELRSPGLE